ncbi:zinc finger BED domain-containing protein RICESLEEPER 2-like [Raphanus sativus]|uniref:Zinc finger BED domain-containing protein RICESLEEPER 2-like n=1 Tax=Raphanus sativus TaxID=3726 RepID=A0A9W3DE21_RAPSA|nr:zinc finger BED domain-containing protein RICESLEEPER 2-like [Raphanus sativus]
MDPKFKYLETCDFETQRLLGVLDAADESHETEMGCSDGKKQQRRRLIEVLDDDIDEVDSDVEETPPPIKHTQPSKQFAFGSGSLSNISGSTSKASQGKPKPVSAVIRGGRRCSKRPPKSGGKKVSEADSMQPQKKKKRDEEEINVDAVSAEDDEDDDRKSRQMSDVWVDFCVIRKPNGQEKAKCNHCKNEYAWSSHGHGTTSLKRHRDVCKMYTRLNGKMNVNAEGRLQPRKYDHLVFRQLVAKTIVQHDLPYSYVEYEKVRDTWRYLNADVKTISRNTAKKDVFRLYESERDTLKRELAGLPGRVSLTSDLWTALTHEGYMCVTAHYIDRNWKLNSKILTFCALSPPHTGMNVAMQLLESLKEWGIEKKVFSITLDNATSNDSMQDIVKSQLMLSNDLLCGGEFFHVRCATHILNLIVQDGLKVIVGSVHKVRESIKYVSASKSREELFEKCVVAAGVKEKAGLILDVQTRWNSTFYMLDRAVKYRKAFVKLEAFDRRGYKMAPTAEEWTRAENICRFLRPFALITSYMSGSTYPTSNLYFYQVWLIHDWLRINEESEDEIVREMVPPMKEKFDKYWEEVSCLFAMAVVFDPRFKLTIVDCCLGKLDMSTRDAKLRNLRDKLSTLFESYDKKSKTYSPSTEPREMVPQNVCAEESMGMFENYDDFFAFRKVSGVVSGKTPLEAYLDEPPLEFHNFKSLDILSWWKDNTHRYGDLSAMACDLLSIPITTVASESSFSIGSRVLNKYRSRLLPQNVQALICTRNWLKGYASYAHDEIDGEEEKLPSFESIVNDKNEDGREGEEA